MRWNRVEGYFEMLCTSCQKKDRACYWPLTKNEFGQPEFWIAGNMQTCRSCTLTAKRLAEKHKRQSDPEHRAKRNQYAKDYYAENKPVVSMKHTQYMREYRAKKKETAA